MRYIAFVEANPMSLVSHNDAAAQGGTSLSWRLRRILLGIIILEIPIGIDVHFQQNYEAGALGALHGISVSLTTLCLLVLVGVSVPSFVRSARDRVRATLPVTIPATIYTLSVCLSLFAATSVSLAFSEIWLLGQSLLILISVMLMVRTREDVGFVVMMLLTGLLFQTIVMLGLAVSRQSIIVGPRVVANISDTGRVGGTLGSENVASAYLALLMPLAAAMAIAKTHKMMRLVAVLSFLLGVPSLLLTGSRGGWFAAVISLSIFCVIALHHGYLRPGFVMVVAAGLGLFCATFSNRIAERVFGDDGGAAYARLPLMHVASEVIWDHPVMGVGANNYAIVAHPYAARYNFRGEWEAVVHNKYLLVWAETGIVGILTFLWFLAAPLSIGWQTVGRRGGTLALVALALWVGILGQTFHMLVDKFNGRALIQMLWLAIGLLWSVCRIINHSGSREFHVADRSPGPIVDQSIMP